MNNSTKRNLAVGLLAVGAVLAAVAIHVETNPKAFTTKRTVTNVTLEVQPIAKAEEPPVIHAETRTINLEPITIVGSLSKPSVGAAMAKKPVAKKARTCYLHRLEQGGSPEHPFVTVCE